MVGTIKIDIGKDAMSVYLYILTEGNTEITVSLLREELVKRGIKAGIDEGMLCKIAEEGQVGAEYLVASGEPAERGKDGYYEFFFERETKECVPTIRADGSVDYSPVIHMVKKGDKVAVYHPAKQGREGYTVFDVMVAPPPAREGERLTCVNVEQRGNEFFAMLDGRISFKEKKLQVKDCLMIEGDAGYSMGDIHFNGDIHVQGDVLTDVAVTAGGSIEVDGVVEGAKLTAGKNILVRRGVHGKEKAVIEAGGFITSNFIEEAKTVKAGKDILVDYVINTDVNVGRKIQATGKKGLLLGGTITAEECIEAIRIGNDRGAKTHLTLRTTEPEKRQNGKIVVHVKSNPGTSADIYGSKIDNLVMTTGEIHFTEFGIEKCGIGEFRYKQPEEHTAERKPLILLVDDDPVVLKTEYSYLCNDYKVVAVSSAQDALVFLKKKLPDLILLDYLMPKMNGGELLEHIRTSADKKCAATPVFFVTSVADKETMAKCLKLYPQGYLLKPVCREELIKIIGEFFFKNPI